MLNLRVVVDLPLVNKDAGVFRNEVSIERCVFRRAAKENMLINK